MRKAGAKLTEEGLHDIWFRSSVTVPIDTSKAQRYTPSRMRPSELSSSPYRSIPNRKLLNELDREMLGRIGVLVEKSSDMASLGRNWAKELACWSSICGHTRWLSHTARRYTQWDASAACNRC